MATPCNGVTECYDDSDENGCQFPPWILPCIMTGAIVALIISCFVLLQFYIKASIVGIIESGRSNSPIQNSTKSTSTMFHVACLIENGSLNEISNLINQEIDAHGSEASAMCCLKVIHNIHNF